MSRRDPAPTSWQQRVIDEREDRELSAGGLAQRLLDHEAADRYEADMTKGWD